MIAMWINNVIESVIISQHVHIDYYLYMKNFKIHYYFLINAIKILLFSYSDNQYDDDD